MRNTIAIWSYGSFIGTADLNKEQIENSVHWQQKKDREIEEPDQHNLFAQLRTHTF